MGNIEKKFARVKREVKKGAPDRSGFEEAAKIGDLEAQIERLEQENYDLKVKVAGRDRVLESTREHIKMLEAQNAELEEAAAENKELSVIDERTGLLNARGFKDKAKTLFKAAARGVEGKEKGKPEVGISFSVIFVDLNDFKPINDTYGHEAGDEALKRVAEALKSSVRDGDLVGRYGGDEFVVALLSVETRGHADVRGNRFIVAERIKRKLEETGFEYNGQRVPALAASIGGAKAQPGDSGLEDVIKRADKMMYKAKEKKTPGESNIEIEGLEKNE